MEQRIGRRDHTYTHPDAVKWLSKFFIQLKKMVFVDQRFQPFTMDYLNEWSEHRKSLESCVDYESTMMKRADLYDNPVHEHADAIMCFNGLIIDLKLMLMGDVYEPFTEKRLNEADVYYSEIVRCKKTRTVFY